MYKRQDHGGAEIGGDLRSAVVSKVGLLDHAIFVVIFIDDPGEIGPLLSNGLAVGVKKFFREFVAALVVGCLLYTSRCV